VEDSAEGQFSLSIYDLFRREVNGVRLWFEKGRVVKGDKPKGMRIL
jgi:hypothetical protein